MQHALPTRKLPAHPSLDQLKRQAKELLEAFLNTEEGAVSEVRRFYRDADPATFALHDAQLALARSYGYDSWPKLKAFVDGVTVKRLIEAVQRGDMDAVRSILDARPELVNTVSAPNDERRAIHYAVLGRMPEMVRTLLRYGASPYPGVYPYREASVPLVIAEERGYEDIKAVFREELAKPNPAGQPGVFDMPPDLGMAFRNRDEDRLIEILNEHPELVRLRTHGDNGSTLLHIASSLLMPRLAAALLRHGADANARVRDGATPLDCAGQTCGPDRQQGRNELVELLRKHGAKPTARTAIALGDAASLRAHHAAGELLAPQDDPGALLRVAIDNDRPEILELLLELGLDPDARATVPDLPEVTFTWGDPLYHCARNGKRRMAEILLQHGADPNAQVYASGTPLSEAFGQRDDEMVALLECHGGKPNPSMAGLYHRKDLALRLLAEHGDTPLPDDGFGSGPVAEQLLAAAARGGDPEILRLALDRVDWPAGDPRWYGPLAGPLRFWNHGNGPWCHPEWDRSVYLECFRMILGRLGPPVRPQRFGATILHHIVTMPDHVTVDERTAFAAAAIDAGAPLDARDDLLQSTPLGWACRWGRPELVRLLLDHGADPVELDAEPWARPLAWAEKKENADIAAMLRATIDGAGDRP